MKDTISPFGGFDKKALEFLGSLEHERYNNTVWFNKNRDTYDNSIVIPSKAFVQSIGQFFNHLNPSIRTEPKFNKTLMRISKDMRFAKGLPYKTYFLIHFGKFKMDSEFYVYLDKNGISYGMFLNNSTGDELYFNQNFVKFNKDILNTCERFGINKKFMLSELNKEPELRIKNFDAKKNLALLGTMKFILLEKQLTIKDKLIFSPDFLTEAIKTFSRLYPLYCFAVSPDPLRLIEEFDERMGIAL